MATTVPGAQSVSSQAVKLQSVKPQSTKPQSAKPAKPAWVKPRGVSHEAWAFDDDPTEYPDFEAVGREPIESDIAEALEPVIRRHLTEQGIQCYIGSDNFIYWTKGNNKDCVSPDIYVFPGMPQNVIPQHFKGHKDEGSWKTWIHGVRPNFAIEVKARRNPRKDELQSIDRHDRLGVKELIVYDPFADYRRRADRKRFAVYRRDKDEAFPKIFSTDEDRVFSEELGAFLVADPKDNGLLRLGIGPRGENLLLFDNELIALESRLRQEESRRADEQARRADEQACRADEQAAELARLRASMSAR
jgi:Uma2 family endonuclease